MREQTTALVWLTPAANRTKQMERTHMLTYTLSAVISTVVWQIVILKSSHCNKNPCNQECCVKVIHHSLRKFLIVWIRIEMSGFYNRKFANQQ